MDTPQELFARLAAQGAMIDRLSSDSRRCAPGVAFFAYPGEKADGRAHIGEAIARGAAAVAWDNDGFAWRPEWHAPHVAVRGLKMRVPNAPIAVAMFRAFGSSPTPVGICTPGGCAAHAYFVAYGEHLFVCDDAKDGYGAIAQYTRSDVPGQNNDARNTNGSGTCIDHNMSMPEGSTITFRVCLLSSPGAISNCSARVTTSA